MSDVTYTAKVELPQIREFERVWGGTGNAEEVSQEVGIESKSWVKTSVWSKLGVFPESVQVNCECVNISTLEVKLAYVARYLATKVAGGFEIFFPDDDQGSDIGLVILESTVNGPRLTIWMNLNRRPPTNVKDWAIVTIEEFGGENIGGWSPENVIQFELNGIPARGELKGNLTRITQLEIEARLPFVEFWIVLLKFCAIHRLPPNAKLLISFKSNDADYDSLPMLPKEMIHDLFYTVRVSNLRAFEALHAWKPSLHISYFIGSILLDGNDYAQLTAHASRRGIWLGVTLSDPELRKQVEKLLGLKLRFQTAQ